MGEPSMNSKTRSFTSSEITNITSNFKMVIGKGGFGEVYLGTLNGGSRVAVKVLSLSSKQGHKAVMQEVKLLTSVHHENLVSLVGYCNEDGNEALIYDYMPNGNLKQQLSGKSKIILSWSERLKIALDVAHGLEYLHGCKPPIVHRDLKPDNILFNKYNQAAIADFGISRAFETESASHISTRLAGTFGYLDPESYKTGHISKKSDVYSFGVILLVLITGLPAIITQDKENKIHITSWIDPLIKRRDIRSIVDRRLEGEFDIKATQKAIEIAVSCVNLVSARPDMSHVLAKLKCLDIEMHSAKERGWLTNLLDKKYKNSMKGPKGTNFIMKSMVGRMKSIEERQMNSRSRTFTNAQIAEITSNFKTVIRKGRFGKVYLGTLKNDADVAIMVPSSLSRQGYNEFWAEIELLSLCNPKNVVSLVGYCDEDCIKALIYEHMANGNLKQYLSEECQRILSWDERLQIALDAAKGLEYLQNGCKSFMVHGNLQTTDILLNENMQAKIVVFRLAKFLNDDFVSIRLFNKELADVDGSIENIDPMYFSSGEIMKRNIYGFGLILLGLITGQSVMIPVEGHNNHIIDLVTSAIKKGDIQSIIDPRLREIINIELARRVVELAMSCASSNAYERPDISHLVGKLVVLTDWSHEHR